MYEAVIDLFSRQQFVYFSRLSFRQSIDFDSSTTTTLNDYVGKQNVRPYPHAGYTNTLDNGRLIPDDCPLIVYNFVIIDINSIGEQHIMICRYSACYK